MIKPVLQPMQPPKRTILTVSELNRQAKGTLESTLGSVWISGEISNLTKAASGHWYFSLKDQTAQIRCAMFKFKVQMLRFSPKEGDKVIIKGKVSLYEARGDYQLIADFMEPAGLGDLQQQLNELINKLKTEGLFAPELKQPLPSLPKRIGVITSPSGAAIQDVLTVLARRCPMVPVIIYPTQVQGESATAQIIAAIDQAETRAECDVLLLTRGGGSLEDLWCFNHEKLAYRIAACQLPIVAAVGHEVDTTIAELVADLRAATPSAAAELLVPDQQGLQQGLDILSGALAEKLIISINQLQNRLNIASLKLADPQNAINTSQIKLEKLMHRLLMVGNQSLHRNQKQLELSEQKLQKLNPLLRLKQEQEKLTQLKHRLLSSWQSQFESFNRRFQIKVSSLETLSPLSTLSRGYSIARDGQTGKIINTCAQIQENQSIDLLLSDGNAQCRVESIKPNQ
ncbi:exodeoxyribonuclease VII large subunit [Aliikangiella marina]|uniref:Exodeoxyribonuclease 7 large subunit n=1 Tax=Aliikangiella marina TaxID=1712262 RepID=A0A545TE30_9GAMM|nr:exodeoxyribonuclease VII large subunit [Aliikangiella marina]TQV75475.1 exodeoxyribonuclease VII large subunit [Aliikangiella marina]